MTTYIFNSFFQSRILFGVLWFIKMYNILWLKNIKMGNIMSFCWEEKIFFMKRTLVEDLKIDNRHVMATI